MAPKTAKSATLAEAEPQKLGLDGGAVRVGKTWRSRKGGAWMAEPCLLGTEGGAGTQLDEVWKAKPKSTKENTRTTKGSEDGRHKHLRKQNISCQKENKSLETIVFQRKQTFCGNVWNSTKKQTQYPNGGKVYFSGRNQSLPKEFVSSDKTIFAQYTFKQRFPTKQTNKTTEKMFVLESFKLVRWKFVSRFRFKNKGCGKRFVCDEKTILFDQKL